MDIDVNAHVLVLFSSRPLLPASGGTSTLHCSRDSRLHGGHALR